MSLLRFESSRPGLANLGLEAQPRIVDVSYMARQDSDREDLEIDEPHYYCLICEERVPVLESHHRRECSKSPLNIKCPMCAHPRRDYLMEEHIKGCCATQRMTPAETEQRLNLYRSSIRYIEHNVEKMREELFEGYKKALHDGNELPFFPCLVCDTHEQHYMDATCLRQIGGNELRWRVVTWIDRNMVPSFEKHLTDLKEENQRKTLEKYEHRLQNPAARERVLQRAARKSDVFIEEKRKQKSKEVDRLVAREMRILGTKMRNYQAFFIDGIT